MSHPLLRDGFELTDTPRTLPIALLRAREAVMARFRPVLSHHGVTEQQWRVLRVLREVDLIDATELARAACILGPSLSRILKTLEAQGYSQGTRDPTDGRRTLVRLTEAGALFIRTVSPDSAAVYREIEARVGGDRIRALLDEIENLLSTIEDDGPRPR